MSARVIGSGLWAAEGVLTITSSTVAVAPAESHIDTIGGGPPVTMSIVQNAWTVGQIVDVRPRTWAGINRPGGTGRITKIHYAPDGALSSTAAAVIEGIDVKYTVSSGYDHNLSPDLLQPHVELEARGRRQRGKSTTVTDSENEHPNERPKPTSKPKQPKSRKKESNSGAAGATALVKKGAGKKLTPTKHKVKKTMRTLMFKPEVAVAPAAAAATSSSTTQQQHTKSDIPREITVNSSEGYVTGSSKAISEPSYSPLGQDGIELHPSDSGSYSVPHSVSKLEDVSMQTGIGANDDRMECDDNDKKASNGHVLQFLVSPRRASSMSAGQESSRLSATPLATGRFSAEGVVATSQHLNDNLNQRDDAFAASKPVTLRDVFDDGVQKARQFIGEVVSRPSQEPPPPVAEPTVDANDNVRFCQFREMLYGLFMECDDVVKVAGLADQIRGVQSSTADDYSFTDSEINDYVSQLCEQDKIMLIDECIYKI